LHFSIDQVQHAIAVRTHAFVVGGDHHRGIALARQLVQQVDDLARRSGIQVGGRLVGDDQGRRLDQGAGDRHALALAAGKRIGQAPGIGLQADPLQRGADPLAAFGRRYAEQQQGYSTLSKTVITGTRLKPWKMKPTFSRRRRVMPISSRPSMAIPPSSRLPASCVSIRPQRLSRVLLPLPDGPVSATISPLRTSRLTPFSASTLDSPTR
jgi:hypothetical protein